jgi:hypothetical protein
MLAVTAISAVVHWASASDTVKLYSFPLIVLGIASSQAILPVTAQGRSLSRGGPGITPA